MIILLVFGGISIAIWLIWGNKSLKKIKSGSSDTSPPRSKLGRHERKLRAQARELYKSGKYQAAAQVLESIGMIKNAVEILEEKGKIHDACKILLRHGHTGTAAVIYARNKQWDQAADCFEKADKQLEAAQCYREGGNNLQAAELFSKQKNFQAAAKCYADAGDLRKAGESYLKMKKVGQAIPFYQALYKKNPDEFIKIRFSSDESRAFRSWLKKEKGDLYLARALGYRKKLRPLLLDLAKEGKVGTGTEILRMVQGSFRDKSMAPKIVSEVSFESSQAGNMAKIFDAAGESYHAGVIYEKLEEFQSAARAYEKAGDQDRAANCYSRAGQTLTSNEGVGSSDRASSSGPAEAETQEPAEPVLSEKSKKTESDGETPAAGESDLREAAAPAGVFSLGDVSEVYTPPDMAATEPEELPDDDAADVAGGGEFRLGLPSPDLSAGGGTIEKESAGQDDDGQVRAAPADSFDEDLESAIEDISFISPDEVHAGSPPAGPEPEEEPEIPAPAGLAEQSDIAANFEINSSDPADELASPDPQEAAGADGIAGSGAHAADRLPEHQPDSPGKPSLPEKDIRFEDGMPARSGSGLTPAELNFSAQEVSESETPFDNTLNMHMDLSSLSESDKRAFYNAEIFRNLTQEQKDRLFEAAEVEELLKEDILMLSRQNDSGLYILLKGCLASNANNTVQLEKNRESGDSLGEAFVFSDINIPETFLAKKDSLICHIASDNIGQLLRDDPEMARQLYKNYTNSLLRQLSGGEKIVTIQDDS